MTLSYTVVTVATLLVLELCLIGGISLLVINSNLLPSALISAVDFFIVPQVVTYLDEPEPDVESLTDWLDIAFAEGISFQSNQNPNIRFHLGDLDQSSTLTVLDQNLDWLAGIPKPNEGVTNEITESSGDLLRAAQRGEKNPDQISRISDDLLTIAVPVTDEGGEVLGIILMVITYPPQGSFIQLLSLIGVSVVIFTLAAGIVGTIFGYFTARGLSKRLRTISSAADSWSQGDFSIFIGDRTGDELSQLAEQLNRMAEQLQNLVQTKQELASMEERNRLARDLHDSVKQQVFATTMQVGAARAVIDQDSSAAREHLDEAEQLSRQAQSELNTIIRELQPESLQGRDLTHALREHVADWSRQNKISADIDIQEDISLPLEVEQTLFRITQEALSNIARHSEATHIKIQLSGEENQVILAISDNGKGFETTAADGKGVGLRSMRERIEALGGSLLVESTSGEGTRLIARCQTNKGGL
jgi:NarL family two-component system sensor histidine kinase LiaS